MNARGERGQVRCGLTDTEVFATSSADRIRNNLGAPGLHDIRRPVSVALFQALVPDADDDNAEESGSRERLRSV